MGPNTYISSYVNNVFAGSNEQSHPMQIGITIEQVTT
jgi:hypothetical protein